MRSNKYKKCTIQVISVKGIICSEECDIDWGEGMSYCQRQQFWRYQMPGLKGLEVAIIGLVND